MIKSKLLKKGVIIGISVLVAFILYITSFDLNENNMELKLGDYLNESNINVIETQEISKGKDKDIVVLFKINDSYGVALLHKGLNNRYIINDALKGTDQIDSVIYKVDGFFYSTIYGGDNNEVSEFKIFVDDNYKTFDINSKYLLITEPIRIYQGSGEIIYVGSSTFSPYELELNSAEASTWKSFLIPIACMLIVILSIIITSFIFNNQNMAESNQISIEGQVKRYWFPL